MLECFEEDETLGALGPMTNASTGPQGSPKYRTTHKRLMKARYPLVGFCLVFPRHVWKEVGGFDEGYEIYGEDSDFIMEIKEHGYIAMIRTDVFIFHHGKSSTPIAIARGKDILKLKKQSKERFLKKWKSGKLTEAQKAEIQEAEEERVAETARRLLERRKNRALAQGMSLEAFEERERRRSELEKLEEARRMRRARGKGHSVGGLRDYKRQKPTNPKIAERIQRRKDIAERRKALKAEKKDG